ncbi:MAG: hypothetical protein WKF75_02855 [Singulisphaera sp.]
MRPAPDWSFETRGYGANLRPDRRRRWCWPATSTRTGRRPAWTGGRAASGRTSRPSPLVPRGGRNSGAGPIPPGLVGDRHGGRQGRRGRAFGTVFFLDPETGEEVGRLTTGTPMGAPGSPPIGSCWPAWTGSGVVPLRHGLGVGEPPDAWLDLHATRARSLWPRAARPRRSRSPA